MDCCVARPAGSSEAMLSSSKIEVTVTVPAMLRLVFAVTVVAVAAAGTILPITTPSAVPPLMSAVVNTAEGTVMTPVEFAIVAAVVPSLAEIDPVSTSVALTTSSLSNTLSIVTPEPAVVSSMVFVVIFWPLSTIISLAPVVLPFARTSDSSLLAPTCESTYALMDCCVAKDVALSEAMLSSSRTAVTTVLVPNCRDVVWVIASTTFVPSQNKNVVRPLGTRMPVPAEVLTVMF